MNALIVEHKQVLIVDHHDNFKMTAELEISYEKQPLRQWSHAFNADHIITAFA